MAYDEDAFDKLGFTDDDEEIDLGEIGGTDDIGTDSNSDSEETENKEYSEFGEIDDADEDEFDIEGFEGLDESSDDTEINDEEGTDNESDDEDDELDYLAGFSSDAEDAGDNEDTEYTDSTDENNIDENVFNSGDTEYNEDEIGTEEDDKYVGIADDGEVIEDDRESPVDEYGNLRIMDDTDGDAFDFQYVDIDNIVVGERIRKQNNSEALTTSVRGTGLLMPVVVAPTATEGLYALVNGLGRLISCAKSGIRRIPCVINKKAKTTELRLLEAMYNHSRQYSIKEILDFIEYLEKERGINKPITIEYLLQMDTGDYTKLKDVISDNDENIVTPLLNGQMTISQAFKKLESRRKKESREEKENRKAAEVYSNTEESGTSDIDNVGETGDDGVKLTDEELSKLGFVADNLDEGLEGENLADMIEEGKNMEGFEPHKQDWKNRERLDPALRKAVLARDDNTSRVDPNISGQEYIECLDVHHIHEVYLGGSDDIDNLITVDIISHKLIHLWARGELHIGDLESMSESEQEKFKRIIKLGNVIRKDMQAKGMKVAELKEVDNAGTIGRTKPGTGQVAG